MRSTVVPPRCLPATRTAALHRGTPDWAPRLFHPLTASRIAAAAEPPDEHRRVSCVFLSLPPTDDRDRVALRGLSDFVATAADVLADAGGDVVQCSGGDKGIVLFAVFGAPVAHPDDPLRAVHAVDRLRATTHTPFAAGISTGLAFSAVFGGRHRGFPSAIGDTTNVAARLMSAAEPGTTLLDGPTTEAGGDRLVADERRSLAVKNRAEPIQVARFRTLTRSSRDLDDEGEGPLVGRETELAAGERLLDRAAHHGSALHLAGEAGSGKSRLAGELARRARIRGISVRVGGFEAFGVSSPLGPFAAFVRDRPGLPPIRAAGDLPSAIGAVRPGDERLSPLLGPLLGLDLEETTATVGLSDDQRADLGRRLVVDLLCATPTPTLLVVEDLHWADEASRSLLAELVPQLPHGRLSIVSTRRPGPLPGCEPVVELADLPPERLATIVRDTWSRLGGGGLPEDYVSTLVERAAGSPMFAQTVTELVRRQYQPGVPLPEVPLPDQLLPFLTAQIDTLGDQAQATALQAAIFGRPVSARQLASTFGSTEAQTRRDLGWLAAAGIVRSSDTGDAAEVQLRHATVAEALVARASHSVRAPLHEQVCRHLIATGASAREVAGHLQHGDLPELELTWYRAARREALAAWALHEARHWAGLALGAAPPADSSADAVALAELEQQLGDLGQAGERLVGLDGPAVEQLRGRIALETGRPADAVEHLQQAERLGADGSGVSWPLTMALCELGRFAEAAERAHRQLESSGTDGPTRLDALANLGVIDARRGDFAGSAARLEQASVLATELGDAMRLATVTGDLAGTRYASDRTAEAAELLGRAADIAERLGSRRMVAFTLGNAAALRLEVGDHEGARRAAVASVRASLQLGDTAAALNALQVPVAVTEADGALETAAAWWCAHAELEERLGRPNDCLVSRFRYATALAGLGRVVTAADVVARTEAAGALDDEDVRNEQDRAHAAVRGHYTPPVDTDAVPVDLPTLDESLPQVTAADIDELFGAIGQLLTERGATAR